MYGEPKPYQSQYEMSAVTEFRKNARRIERNAVNQSLITID